MHPTPSLFPRRTIAALCAALSPLALYAQGNRGDDSGPRAVSAIADSLRVVRQAELRAGVPDCGPAALATRRRTLDALSRRHAGLTTTGWSTPERVDHAVVGTQLASVDFELRVSKPWARDAGYWVDLIARVPYAGLPLPDAQRTRLVSQLQSVPRILTEARTRLTTPSAELAGMAIFALEQSDEINQGEPRRPRPPAGTIGWYEDLLARARTADAALVPDVEAALTAVRAFRDWLRQSQPTMTEPAHVGLANYEWYLRHVRLVPWTVEQVRLTGERELARARTLLAIERHRNRNAVQVEPAATAVEHERRTREAETLIRTFTAREGLMTIPADIPDEYETDAFFIDRTPWGSHRHFWDEITYRDPLNNHIHASIPGHRFDGTLQRKNPSAIRRGSSDGTRAEGWAFWIEEMYLQAGLLQDRPRTRELFYIAQLKRAARIHAELRMQTGEWSLRQAIDYLNAEVPLMEENLARYDLAIYLRRPAYGMNYTIGKAQMEQLLSDRQRQLGDRFVLGAFNDEFLSKGSIPISLIRWEMTGLDDEMRLLGVVR